jgi:hypothetical protein
MRLLVTFKRSGRITESGVDIQNKLGIVAVAPFVFIRTVIFVEAYISQSQWDKNESRSVRIGDHMRVN